MRIDWALINEHTSDSDHSKFSSTQFKFSHDKVMRCSVRNCVLRNFVKITGKHLCQSCLFSLRPATSLKKETLAQVFSSEFWEISENTFFTEQLWMAASEERIIVSVTLSM